MSRTEWSKDDPESITAALNRVYDGLDEEPDPAVLAAGIETLKRVEWDAPRHEPEPSTSHLTDHRS